MRATKALAAHCDVTSPTGFNTLSNVYATAVDRSTPVQEKPPTAILGRRPVLRLQTTSVSTDKSAAAHSVTYTGPYLDTPVTAQPISPALPSEICFPSAIMTATPPLSAQPSDQHGAQVFTFDGKTAAATSQDTPKQAAMPKLPYKQPPRLKSILRNSPLPHPRSPESPRRRSARLQERAARRVAYNSPLTQEITTTKYTKSHIELLMEATPDSSSPSVLSSESDDGDAMLDQVMTDADTRDGGATTASPFEDVRRRLASMGTSSSATATSPVLSPTSSGGIRKNKAHHKRREKKRRWVWTIGQDDEDDETTTPVTAIHTPAQNQQQVSTGMRSFAPAGTVSVPVLAIPTPRKMRSQAQQAKAAAAMAQVQVQVQVQVPVLAVPTPPTRGQGQGQAQGQQQQQQQQQLQLQLQQLQQQQPQGQTQVVKPKQEEESRDERPHAREPTSIPASLLPEARPSRSPSPEPASPGLYDALRLHTQYNPQLDQRYQTPEPTAVTPTPMILEPPTPSVESTVSIVSSSNASSAGSEVFDHDSLKKRRASLTQPGEGDVDMSDVSSLHSEEDECETAQRGEEGVGVGVGVGSSRKRGRWDGMRDVIEMDYYCEGTPTMTARPTGRGWAPWREVIG